MKIHKVKLAQAGEGAKRQVLVAVAVQNGPYLSVALQKLDGALADAFESGTEDHKGQDTKKGKG